MYTTPSVLLAVAGSLSLVLASGRTAMPARRTLAVDVPEYDAGLAPAPTPDPGQGVHNAMLSPRALGSNTCGYRSMNNGNFLPVSCGTNTECYTAKSHFGCKPTPFTACYDTSASICKQTTSSLGPKILCCTNSDSTRLPLCVTYVKNDGGQKTMYRCGNNINTKPQIIFLGTKTDDPIMTTTTDTSKFTSGAPTESPDSSSSNTGAIVGGVVGGVAVMAIAVCVVVWLIVRRRRQARDDPPPPFTPGQTPGQKSQYSQPYYQGYSGQPQQGYEGYGGYGGYGGEHYKPSNGPSPSPGLVPGPQAPQEVPATPVNGANARNPAELGP